MADATGRDLLAIRRRILEEYKKVYIGIHPKRWRSATLRAHERICESMGEDYVNYPEFEFWFLRFARGNFDLDYDRSSDPKHRSFTDLPLDIFENIGEYLKLEDKMRLRNVCKDVRFRVDNCKLRLTEISYSTVNNWRTIKRFCSGSTRNCICFVMSVLKLPNLRLEKLTIQEQDDNWKELIRELDNSNQKLYVKNVEFRYNRSSKIDLHFMIPGVLEVIKMFPVNLTREEFYEIIESEQCQSAKMVYIDSWIETSKFPLNALYNCPRFTLRLRGKHADSAKSKFLKTLMKKGEVQKCVLHALKQILKYFNESKAMVPNFPLLRRYPISGTNEFYELEYREKSVHLERKQ
ncbi:hypothetical protein CRE_25878 [Caenorhabditis remanei]|uniref:F-box domain-containing protein n=1 Tax=Caenorhabditis remanei TaxID=31234 RepID=E3NDT1_CAERE|nr:hypothetical protein CRE_25878 [Caenorhabditis remanei]